MDAVEFLIEFLRIYSPTGEEEGATQFLLERMLDFGFRTYVDRVGNVIGTIGEGKPTLLLCGHIDTVPGFIPVKLVGDELFGRGAVDAKGPLAAMIMAAKDFVGKRLNGTVIVAGVVDEEGESRGIKNIIVSGLKADYAVFGEPSNGRNIVIGYKGNLHLKVKVETRAGHPASPATRNASEEMISIWEIIKEMLVEHEKKGKLRVPSCSILSMKGDLSKAEMEISIRVPFGETWLSLFERIRPVVEVKDGFSERQVEIIDAVDPYEADKKSPLVEAFRKSIKEVYGEEARLLRKTGTGDMNYYGNWLKSGNIITYGPGDPQLDHTHEERINLNDYLRSIEVLRGVIHAML
ncbi:MAG: M20/M25/M40 family metallo-hydrolase [Candidatus Jordarchaeales archaeon]